MANGACENCGNDVDVAPVTYTDDGRRVTHALCADCKERLVGRRRTRGERVHRRHRRSRVARLGEVVREGGPVAYVGVGLFLLGVVLVPVLVLVSFLTR